MVLSMQTTSVQRPRAMCSVLPTISHCAHADVLTKRAQAYRGVSQAYVFVRSCATSSTVSLSCIGAGIYKHDESLSLENYRWPTQRRPYGNTQLTARGGGQFLIKALVLWLSGRRARRKYTDHVSGNLPRNSKIILHHIILIELYNNNWLPSSVTTQYK